jgi:ribosome-associated heat shock protein Hsp15
MRMDKFLWCVRLCKTRSVAAEQCRRGQVQLNGQVAKASGEVKPGDTVAVRQPPIWRLFSVLKVPANRVGAKLVPELVQDTTPWEELEKQEMARQVRAAERPAGLGRPTKRERREIDAFRREE